MSFDSPLPPYNSSDPGASFISTSALDFLLIELVPLAYRITSENPQPSAAGGPLSSPTPNDGVSTTNNTTTATTMATTTKATTKVAMAARASDVEALRKTPRPSVTSR